MEEHLNGKGPQRKTPQMETTSKEEEYINGGHPQWQTALMKDELNIDSIKVNNLN